MTAGGFEVFQCTACGAVEFPRRLLCPQCGKPGSRAVVAREGVVEETTVVRHSAGTGNHKGNGPEPLTHLATVLADAGPRVIARLDGALPSGMRVVLRVDPDGAIVAGAAGGSVSVPLRAS